MLAPRTLTQSLHANACRSADLIRARSESIAATTSAASSKVSERGASSHIQQRMISAEPFARKRAPSANVPVGGSKRSSAGAKPAVASAKAATVVSSASMQPASTSSLPASWTGWPNSCSALQLLGAGPRPTEPAVTKNAKMHHQNASKTAAAAGSCGRLWSPKRASACAIYPERISGRQRFGSSTPC